MRRRPIFLVDANALIDYLKVDQKLLPLMARHVGELIIPRRIAEEVLDEKGGAINWSALGVTVLTEELCHLIEAQARRAKQRQLSYPDHLMVVLAEELKHVCVTNDVALRKALENLKLRRRWSLELLLDLIKAKALTADDAIDVVRSIAGRNKRLPATIVADLTTKAQKIA